MKLFEDWTTRVAIEFIQKHEPPEGYFLGFSGGKDSVVLYNLTEKSGVKFQAYYSNTGIDPPEVVHFIKKNYPDIIFLRPKTSFYKAVEQKGFPTKFARWCCDYLKKDPSKPIKLNHRLMGVRAEESAKRAKRGEISALGKWVIYKPIFNWLEWEIWDYIEKNSLPYCKLYDEGFHRIGCVICPFICGKNQTNLELHKKRWPAMYKAFEKSMYNLWINREQFRQRKKNYSFSFEEFLENWYLANPNDPKQEKETNHGDE